VIRAVHRADDGSLRDGCGAEGKRRVSPVDDDAACSSAYTARGSAWPWQWQWQWHCVWDPHPPNQCAGKRHARGQLTFQVLCERLNGKRSFPLDGVTANPIVPQEGPCHGLSQTHTPPTQPPLSEQSSSVIHPVPVASTALETDAAALASTSICIAIVFCEERRRACLLNVPRDRYTNGRAFSRFLCCTRVHPC
jgi:hypothetical protein